MDQNQINKIKEATENFFNKTSFSASKVEVLNFTASEGKEALDINVELDEPQILIGQSGQTLLEIQRILRMLLNKKLGGIFFINLDINSYKKKKSEHLIKYAQDAANEAVLYKKEISLSPMPAYERRVIHAELSKRADIATESRGDGENRHIIVRPKN